MLLGLLLLSDWYFPASTAATATTDTEIDRSIIRIHSRHKWPAAVQIDTRTPMPKADPAIAEATAPDAAVERVRQAYASEPPPPQKALEKSRRRANPSRPLSHDQRQHWARYRPPDSQGWPRAGW
jgi:hypothetical protein